MNDIETRLAQCFRVVFPALAPDAIAGATQDSVAEWDSVATVTLLTVIEEEFGVALDFEELEKLTSFRGVAAMLAARAGKN